MLDKTSRYEFLNSSAEEIVLIDRTIEEDFFVFCSALRSYGILIDDEYELLKHTFEFLSRSWRRPNVVIYLSDTPENCLLRILNRGLPGDNKMELDYVRKISSQYQIWAKDSIRQPSIELNPSTSDFREAETVVKILERLRQILDTQLAG